MARALRTRQCMVGAGGKCLSRRWSSSKARRASAEHQANAAESFCTRQCSGNAAHVHLGEARCRKLSRWRSRCLHNATSKGYGQRIRDEHCLVSQPRARQRVMVEPGACTPPFSRRRLCCSRRSDATVLLRSGVGSGYYCVVRVQTCAVLWSVQSLSAVRVHPAGVHCDTSAGECFSISVCFRRNYSSAHGTWKMD